MVRPASPTARRPRSASGLCGLYRGEVLADIDPLALGRLSVSCPEAFQGACWATPCFPMAGPNAGAVFMPPVGALVWLQFEGGRAESPVWMGGFWASAAEAATGPQIALRSTGQSLLAISDLPGPDGGVQIRSATGATIQVNDLGILIDNGRGATIRLQGPSVFVNGDALEIT